jgi:hypothetical protein
LYLSVINLGIGQNVKFNAKRISDSDKELSSGRRTGKGTSLDFEANLEMTWRMKLSRS